MKVQAASDLHTEIGPLEDHLMVLDTNTDVDVLVLAGDIGVGHGNFEFARKILDQFNNDVEIIMIAGNHEYYKGQYSERLGDYRLMGILEDNIHFLENEEIIIDGVRFLGCTLWTDFVVKEPEISQSEALILAQMNLSDFRSIYHGSTYITAATTLSFHLESRAWLEKKLSEDFPGKTVVVTHHGPSWACKHHEYGHNEASPCFYSDLTDLVKKADVWIYGHTHSNLDTTIGSCRLVSNQYGYRRRETTSDFNPGFVLEV